MGWKGLGGPPWVACRLESILPGTPRGVPSPQAFPTGVAHGGDLRGVPLVALGTPPMVSRGIPPATRAGGAHGGSVPIRFRSVWNAARL